MSPESSVKLITLNPGDYAFGEGGTVLQTLLGSCVAITFWVPRWKFGAMCHYILPTRPSNNEHSSLGCYAEETLPAIAGRFIDMGLRADDMEIRMFGGGNMFPMQFPQKETLIGEQNIAAGRRLLKAFGFSLAEEDVAGEMRRKVTFEILTGRVQVQHGVGLNPDLMERR
ncbi:putative chemoreceptor glutamine deamidase CheD [Geothrix limicola]|uniref:Probable chemoreceptor glutamine deamidase CheD n=1 Tax=Geothrix limicola TaxID=2927978 RepID=A0ABQ5QBA3_9BACT|nr:chemotaxis protein CheD [Geothrix limicola]GLH71730.1 putative chemoreceptor glutamine deamidase CheD [Geothrix limicola]